MPILRPDNKDTWKRRFFGGGKTDYPSQKFFKAPCLTLQAITYWKRRFLGGERQTILPKNSSRPLVSPYKQSPIGKKDFWGARQTILPKNSSRPLVSPYKQSPIETFETFYYHTPSIRSGDAAKAAEAGKYL